MNNKTIIDRYKKEKIIQPLFKLKEGGDIIGQEIDEKNMLHYVIRKGNNISVDYAGNHRVSANLTTPETMKLRVSTKDGEKIVDEIKEKL